jgi:CHASE2 domain-containing sensor protein
MGMLELGTTRPQKRTVIVTLLLIHLLSLGGLVAIFALHGSPNLPPLLAVLMVVATTLWLLTFVLLFVNIAYYFMRRS